MIKKLLIVGCSHAAGFEINGGFDSDTNRSKSFGNILAHHMDRKPINIAVGGASNQTITRNTLEYITDRHREEDDLFVLIAWSESVRLEIPIIEKSKYQSYNLGNFSSDDFFETNNRYLMVNLSSVGKDIYQSIAVPQYQRFITENTCFMEIYSANLVLMLQNFFKSKNIEYMMCNTLHMFSDNEFMNVFKQNIDVKKYYMFDNNELSFWYRYKNLGFKNANAKYWHHGEDAHRLYADELFAFYNKNYVEN
jgi:hypothetical protein